MTHAHKYFRYTWILETIHIVYIAEVIIYFSQCTPPIYDVDGLGICELQEMYSDCLILQPVHNKKTANIGLQIDEIEHGDN